VDDGGGWPPISTSRLKFHPAGNDHKMGSLAAADIRCQVLEANPAASTAAL
jgi:hypothetical protein